MLKRLIAVSLLTLGALASLWPAAAQTSGPPQYYVTDLGLLPDATGSSAQAINDQGCVVGYVPASQSGGNRGGWLWTPNPADRTQGTLTPLKPVQAPPSSCIAVDINSEGLIVGQSSGGDSRATCWTDPNAPLDFNTVLLNPDGWKLISAWAVSDPGPAGEVYVAGTGRHESAPTTSVGLVWCFSGGVITSLTSLEIPPDSTYVGVNDINRLGQMAGTAVRSTYAHRWETNGQYLVLGTFGGALMACEGINDDGAVVGSSATLDRGWIWTPATGQITALNAPVDNRCAALAINNSNQIVGDAVFTVPARKPYTVRRACLWQNAQAYNLNSLKTAGATGLELLEATSINNQGSITGRYNSTKGSRAVLLTPR